MNIYIAARYERRREMVGYRGQLEAAGHMVIARWIDGEHENADAGLGPAAQEWASDDLQDLARCETFVTFTEPPESGASRGGRHVELGLALAWGYRVIVVGYRENVFHWLPEVEWHATWEEAFRALSPAVVQR